MRKLVPYLLACVAAAVAPLVAAAPLPPPCRGWPSQLDGRPLTQLADTPEELRFYAEHPTRHARFSDGERIVLMRWSDADIAGFHLAGPCFRAFGFQIRELPAGASDDWAPDELRDGKAAGPEITFMGYRSLPGGRGTLFVELSEIAVVDVGTSGHTLEYKMMGARVPLKNNKHPLLLRDFESSALMAVLVPGKKAVSLVITLRSAVPWTHRMLSRGKGAVLEVDLPALAGR